MLSNLLLQNPGEVDMLTRWHLLWSNFQGCHLWFNGSQLAEQFSSKTAHTCSRETNFPEKHPKYTPCSFYSILSPWTHTCRLFTDWLSQVSKLHASVQLLYLRALRASSYASSKLCELQALRASSFASFKLCELQALRACFSSDIPPNPEQKIYLSNKFEFKSKVLQVRYPTTLLWRFIFVFTFQPRFASFPEIVWHWESVPKSK